MDEPVFSENAVFAELNGFSREAAALTSAPFLKQTCPICLKYLFCFTGYLFLNYLDYPQIKIGLYYNGTYQNRHVCYKPL